MDKIMKVLQMILQHLVSNFSNYCLSIGTILVQYYIYIEYGLPTSLLSIGVCLILISIINEANKLNKKSNKRY